MAKLVTSTFSFIANAYEEYQEGKIHKHYEKKRKVKEKVTQAVNVERSKPKEEQSDEKLKQLMRRLHNLGGSE